MRNLDKTMPRAAIAVVALLAHLACTGALAQSSCSSDGQRAPTGLLERFISADCASCWADPATLGPGPRVLALDWIVPSARGDDAPLSAAASRDAVQRLEALKQPVPNGNRASNVRHPVAPGQLKLRVARGVALGGYMGASIELTAAPGKPLPPGALTAWLLLVEEVPAGTDGTPVPRMLIRNAHLPSWNVHSSLSKQKQSATPPSQRLYESRPMSLPEGANPDRIRAVGWVEDAKGRVIASAASVCKP